MQSTVLACVKVVYSVHHAHKIFVISGIYIAALMASSLELLYFLSPLLLSSHCGENGQIPNSFDHAVHPPPTTAVPKYDHLFCQSDAQDTSLCWDAIKENIYVWAITKKGQSLYDKLSIMSRLVSYQDCFSYWRKNGLADWAVCMWTCEICNQKTTLLCT